MGKFSKKGVVIALFIIILLALFAFSVNKNKNKTEDESITASAFTAIGNVNNGTQPDLITKDLRLGNVGNDVAILQKFLTDNNYPLGNINGVFGFRTQIALKKFQLDNGKFANGILDTVTRDFINKIITDKSINSNLDNNNDIDGQQQDNQIDTNLPDEVQKQQQEENQRRRAEDQRQLQEVQRQEAEKKAEELRQQQENSITFVETKNINTLFKDYACEAEKTNESLTIFTGETINESVNKKAVYGLSDVWTTYDGVNWKKQANSTDIGTGWERMIEKDKNGVIYSFGGKYKVVDNNTVSDNGVYKTTNMVDWTYVGEIPEMDHRYDRSVVYYKDKFWLISSMDGIWNSPDGKTWTKQLNKGPWSGYGNERRQNAWGYYDSNSLGGYVIKDKMWYLVYNGQSDSHYNNVIRIYSTTDGINWRDEGDLINAKNSQIFNILPNINPDPVTWNNEIFIVSSDKGTGKPLVIKTADGKNWYQVSTSDTKFYKENEYFANVRNYGSVAVFLNKIWHIGGWDLQANTQDNDNINDVWSSSDGIKWENITPKNIEFPGPAGRWLAGVATTGDYGIKAGNLSIEKKWNDSGFFTGYDQKETTLGTWKVFAQKDGNNSGDIVISSLSFVGSDFRDSKNNQFSSLATLKNITVYADGVKVGSVSSFTGPFYDSSGEYALAQKVAFDKDVIIKDGENVTFTLVADFPVPPQNKNFEMRTWLNEIGFKDTYTTPCNISTEFYSDGYSKLPGKLIGWK